LRDRAAKVIGRVRADEGVRVLERARARVAQHTHERSPASEQWSREVEALPLDATLIFAVAAARGLLEQSERGADASVSSSPKRSRRANRSTK
jgi:hypothetical protein